MREKQQTKGKNMAHGIGMRDFVYGLEGQGTDWHNLTQEKPSPLSVDMFPQIREVQLCLAGGKKVPWHVLVSDDDGGVCGGPFDKETFGYILPDRAWKMVHDSISGTHYTIERIGMLHDRSFWFVSIALDELKEVSRSGEKFQLNFSGGLDGLTSPQGELSSIRAVCANTINLSRATGNVLFKIRQTKNSSSKLDEAKSDVEKAVGMAKVYNEVMDSLERTPCNASTARYAYAGEVSRNGGDFSITRSKKTGEERENRSINLVTELVSCFQFGKGNKGETRFDVLQGYTQLHTLGREKSSKDPWTQMESSEFGLYADRKAGFLNTIMDDDKFNELVEVGKEVLGGAN
jgi:hypothetical protein